MNNINTKKVFTQVKKSAPANLGEMRLAMSEHNPNYTVVKGQSKPTLPHIRKLSKAEYVVLTGENKGEVRRFGSEEHKTTAHLRDTFQKLRGLIRANFYKDPENQVFVTLTYRENMCDVDRAYFDYKDFYERLTYALAPQKLEYISVIEPQGRGAWHFHVMIKSDTPLWISKDKIKDIWGRERGNAYIERLKSDEVGAYYVSYFTDILTNEQKANADVHDPEQPEMRHLAADKKRLKGNRLRLYPKHTQFYRCSAGIVRPSWAETHSTQLENLGKPTFETTTELYAESGEQLNTYYKAEFKKGVGNHDKNNRDSVS